MAEASMAVYGAAIGVAVYLAVLAFFLRQRRPHGSEPVETSGDESVEKEVL